MSGPAGLDPDLLGELARRADDRAGRWRRWWWRWRPRWLGCPVCGQPATRRDRYGWTCNRHAWP